MDVVSIPKIDKYYRILPDYKGRLILHEIEEKDATFKLAKINNKTTVKGGKTQLNLHDGRNVLTEDEYKTDDVVLLNIP